MKSNFQATAKPTSLTCLQVFFLGKKKSPHQRVWIQNQAAYGVQSDLDLKVIESGISSSGVNKSLAEGWLYVVNGQSGYIASPR